MVNTVLREETEGQPRGNLRATCLSWLSSADQYRWMLKERLPHGHKMTSPWPEITQKHLNFSARKVSLGCRPTLGVCPHRNRALAKGTVRDNEWQVSYFQSSHIPQSPHLIFYIFNFCLVLFVYFVLFLRQDFSALPWLFLNLLKLRDLPSSTSNELGLKECTPTIQH